MRSTSHFFRQPGYSLVELMIAMTIGLLLLAGLTTLFAGNSATREEVEKTNRQIENGRYAIQVLTDDLRLAGFLGEFNPNGLTVPSAKPDPCATAVADLSAALPLHIQGYDGGATPALSCLSDVAAGSDILVIRHAANCVAGTTGCDAETTGVTYFQASLCNNASELDSAVQTDYFAIGTGAALNKHKRNCTTAADKRRYEVHIYFVANNDNSGDGIKTLKRAELGSAGFTIVPLAEGIENLQFEYGLDTDGDGTPDVYTADPDTYNACTGIACVTNWTNAVTIKVNLLARNTAPTTGYTDAKTYTLGLNASGQGNTFGPYNDAYKRHAYQTVVRMPNPAGRREP